ncbi:MAG: biotin--[acetyl-CoA-carboxylase] ligase [Thermodesulfobacteriota bacterium]
MTDLISAPDIPWPWAFPGRQDRIHYFPRTGSTMDDARRLADRGCPHMTVVIAGVQTKGRGRMDRTWASDDGGLYFTMVIKPEGVVRPAEAVKFNFMASLALAETIREECRVDARVKWPNDLMVEGRKLSGMLSEMEAPDGVIDYVNIGIGLNVNNDPPAIDPPPVSLRSLTGRSFSRIRILGLFLDRFEALLQNRPDFAAVMTGWKKYAGSLNREVTIVTLRETLHGFAEDVDGQGALVLRLADGTRRTVCCGDCFYG